jgi:FlaA1/EpsC-like NDP-sugar epimerase
MSNILIQFLKTTVLGKRFLNLGFLPRWIIFSIDVFIVFLATIATFFIVETLTNAHDGIFYMPNRYTLILGINGIFFMLFRTFSGVIRHSTFIDGVKLLISTTCAFAALVILNFLHYFVYGVRIYLTTELFIGYVISFLLLFLFRIMVKYIFEVYSYSSDDKKKLVRTMIYGADANAISVANALRTEKPSRFKLIGFVDKYNQSSASKSILNLPILNHNKNIHQILKTFNTEALIIADKNLTITEKNAIVEECLEYDIKVFTVPVITNWEDQDQISQKVKNFDIEDLLERKPIVLNTNSISNQLKGKTILITGAAGSIGSEITRQVFKFQPKKIIILDQAETPLHNLRLELKNANSEIKIRNILADIRNADVLEQVFSIYKPDVVYHAAAYKHVPIIEENPAQALYTNILGTKNLADLSQKYNVERFVMVSTDKAVNPSSVMGASKRIAEKYVQSLQFKMNLKDPENCTKFITTRFGNVLGSNGSIVPLFTKQIHEGGPVTLTHPEIIRYFMTIPEACQLVLEAGTMGNGGEIYIFDMGQPVKILDLAKKMIRLAGFTPDKEIKIEIIGLRPGEKLYEELLNDTSKTLPTHNEKIMIAEDICEDYNHVNEAILELASVSKTISNDAIVFRMKKIVPEFKSMNSIYETLDVEVKF